jgi:hypothetical protein
MTDTTCDYRGCEQDATVTRVLRSSGTQYDYCGQHDPLENSEVADLWVEV